jgi:type VI secretion system secreted protein Hcp
MAALDRSPGVDVPRSANPVALFLTANGMTVEGDLALEKGEGAIECVSYVSSVTGSSRQGGGLATASGRRVHDGISIRKPIDRATPLLAKALCNNEVIEATFKFFRPSPSGDGTTEQFFTVEIDQGRVMSIAIVSPDGFSNADPAPPVPAFEDITFSYASITWRYEPTGAEHTDTVAIR